MKKEGHRRGGRRGGEGGPKTFRRGRALAFLERMHLKRSTIKEQLEQPEFQSIQSILVGELKAIDMVIVNLVSYLKLMEMKWLRIKTCQIIVRKELSYDEAN